MSLSNLVLSEALKLLIKTKEPLLKERIEGGISTIRNEDFLTNDFKNEELISPPDGLYKVNKEVEEWVLKNVSAPGMDPDELKKKVWKKHSDEMSKEISKQLTDWLREDVMFELAIIINTQIKATQININLAEGAIDCGGYPSLATTITTVPSAGLNPEIVLS
tara:strand:+ start:14440 stop:14928 length:489 start_codon:yes stop_codon:yes gene_type:complete